MLVYEFDEVIPIFRDDSLLGSVFHGEPQLNSLVRLKPAPKKIADCKLPIADLRAKTTTAQQIADLGLAIQIGNRKLAIGNSSEVLDYCRGELAGLQLGRAVHLPVKIVGYALL